jgi:hypothetical protein
LCREIAPDLAFVVAAFDEIDSFDEMKTRLAPPFAVILLGFLAPPANAADPAPLKESRQEYQRALARAAAPLKEKYLARLNHLLRQYTKVGDLNAAVAIKKEIQALWLEGDWELTAKKNGKTEQVWFDAKGICSYGPGPTKKG